MRYLLEAMVKQMSVPIVELTILFSKAIENLYRRFWSSYAAPNPGQRWCKGVVKMEERSYPPAMNHL